MSRYAMAALLLITCEARRGEWVSLHVLMQRLLAPSHLIESTAAELVAANKLAYATHAGHPYWGVGVEGLLPESTQSTNQSPKDTHD